MSLMAGPATQQPTRLRFRDPPGAVPPGTARLLRDFPRFVLHPGLHMARSRAGTLRRLGQTLALQCVATALILLAHLPFELGWLPSTTWLDDQIEANPMQALLMAVVILPPIEELAFRLALSFRKCDVFLGLFLLTIFLWLGWGDAIGLPHWSAPGVIGAICGAAFVARRLGARRHPGLTGRGVALAVNASVLLFALMHLGERPDELTLLPRLLSVLPQYAMAWGYAYLRLRLGFRSAILAHAWHNLITLGITLAVR